MCQPKAGVGAGFYRVIAPGSTRGFSRCSDPGCRHQHGGVTKAAERFAIGGVVVLILAHLTGFMQGVFITLVSVGALTVGAVIGYAYIRWVLAPRRRAARLSIRAAAERPAIRPRPGLPAIRDAAGAPAELPQSGGQHLHIHIGAGADMEQVNRIIRGGGA